MQKSPRSSISAAAGSGGRRSTTLQRWPAIGLLALIVGLFGLAATAVPTGQAMAGGPCTTSSCVSVGEPAAHSAADPSPTPTLGSTESPNPMLPGDNDGDASDFGGAVWMLPAAFILAGIAAAVFFLRNRSRNRSR
jgi:hypothetical protein